MEDAMKISHAIFTGLLLSGISVAVSGPNDRQPTDPKSAQQTAKSCLEVVRAA